MSPGKVCNGCGKLIPRGQPRCPDCTLTQKRDWTERKRRRRTVESWKESHGNLCPGWKREPHYSEDLTADHIHAQVEGGSRGPLRVLCRACNSSRGAS